MVEAATQGIKTRSLSGYGREDAIAALPEPGNFGSEKLHANPYEA